MHQLHQLVQLRTLLQLKGTIANTCKVPITQQKLLYQDVAAGGFWKKPRGTTKHGKHGIAHPQKSSTFSFISTLCRWVGSPLVYFFRKLGKDSIQLTNRCLNHRVSGHQFWVVPMPFPLSDHSWRSKRWTATMENCSRTGVFSGVNVREVVLW